MERNGRGPEERHQTIRQEIVARLTGETMTAAALSRLVRRPEKEIHEHLEALLMAGRIGTLPATCLACGYIFDQHRKTKKPGKCPKCRATRIRAPAFICPAE